MPRRLLGACLMALTALAALSPRSVAKPPDLPNNPVIIVQPGGAPGSPQVPPSPALPSPRLIIPSGMIHDGFASGWAVVTEVPGPTEEWANWLPEAVLFNIHPLMTFLPAGHFTAAGSEEPCEPEGAQASPASGPQRTGCPQAYQGPCDKHACALADVGAAPTVLENLKALEKADECVRQAKVLMKRGQYSKAAECLARVGQICPGAPCAREAEALRAKVLARARAEEEKVNAEEEEEPTEGCNHGPLAGCLRGVQQLGMCQFKAAVTVVGQLAAGPAHGPMALHGVEGKLWLPVSVDYRAVPLEAVLNNLSGGFGVPIVVHQRARVGCGSPMTQTVSLTLNHVPLRHVLDVVVRPLGLEPVVQGDAVHITAAAPADSCRMAARCEEACEPCPRAQKLHEAHCAGARTQVDGLIKACYLAVEAKRYGKAAELARQAYAMDPARVEGDPLVYKMHLLGERGPKHDEPAIDLPAGCPAGAAGEGPQAAATSSKPAGRVTLGVGVSSNAGLTGSIEVSERTFDLPAVPVSREYLDDLAFRGAEEKQARSEATPWLNAVKGFLVSQITKPLNTDQPGGFLMLGVSTGGINVYCKTPAKGRDVHLVIRGGLPLLWTTPARAAD